MNIGQELVILFGFPYDRSALNKLWITQIFCHKKNPNQCYREFQIRTNEMAGTGRFANNENKRWKYGLAKQSSESHLLCNSREQIIQLVSIIHVNITIKKKNHPNRKYTR